MLSACPLTRFVRVNNAAPRIRLGSIGVHSNSFAYLRLLIVLVLPNPPTPIYAHGLV